MAHPNESVLRDAYEAFAKRDGERLLSMLAEDVVFHIPGRSAISGTHAGRDGILALFEQLDTLSEATLQLELQHILADDSFAVVLVLAIADPEGRAYEGRDVHVWRVAQGRLAELWVHPGDQYEADAFFSPVREAPKDDTRADETAADETTAPDEAEVVEKVTEVVKADEDEGVPSRARRVAAKALGAEKPPAQEAGAVREDNGSGRRPKRGAPRERGS